MNSNLNPCRGNLPLLFPLQIGQRWSFFFFYCGLSFCIAQCLLFILRAFHLFSSHQWNLQYFHITSSLSIILCIYFLMLRGTFTKSFCMLLFLSWIKFRVAVFSVVCRCLKHCIELSSFNYGESWKNVLGDNIISLCLVTVINSHDMIAMVGWILA